MFKTSGQIGNEELKLKSCELLCSRRQANDKSIEENKDICCKPLRLLFTVNSYQVSCSQGGDEEGL